MKCEEVYLKDYDTVPTDLANLKQYFLFYIEQRLHQAIDYQTLPQSLLKEFNRFSSSSVLS